MNKSKITLVVDVILIFGVFAFVGAGFSSAAARGLDNSNCVDAYAGGPDFLVNARPDSQKIAYNRNCLAVDNGPTFLVNSHVITSGPLDFTAECPQIQTGAPTFLVNAEPTLNLRVAEMEGKCTPG